VAERGSRGSVLVIVDDPHIRRVLRLTPEREGFAVAEAGSGEDGLAVFARQDIDLVCLDLLLPGCDGFQVCRDIRGDSAVPIIMVTARADSHDVVGGLEAGADDYVTKPFRAQELSARIRALLRRSEGTGLRGRVRIGDVEMWPRDGVVLRAGRPVGLTRTEFGLLRELADAGGAVLTREDLLERVWGCGYFGHNRLVDVHVGRLRRKIEDDPREPCVVLTACGLGYRLGL
jgi:DNA-binding response OmpR family regulator